MADSSAHDNHKDGGVKCGEVVSRSQNSERNERFGSTASRVWGGGVRAAIRNKTRTVSNYI